MDHDDAPPSAVEGNEDAARDGDGMDLDETNKEESEKRDTRIAGDDDDAVEY